jgi:hypothetical protein
MLFQKHIVHTTFNIYVFIIHPCYVLNHRPVSLDCPFLIAFSVFQDVVRVRCITSRMLSSEYCFVFRTLLDQYITRNIEYDTSKKVYINFLWWFFWVNKTRLTPALLIVQNARITWRNWSVMCMLRLLSLLCLYYFI